MKVLTLAILVHAIAPWAGLSAPTGTLDEKLPPRVAETTRRQIERYLGTNNLKGVPLLDRTVDWDLFSNWPDQFTFKERTYRLALTDWSGGDYFSAIKSRAQVRPGMRFSARYSTGTNFPPPLRVSSVWNGDGSVTERIVDVEGERAFGHQFHPTGRLYLFSRDDAETKEYAREYFDSSSRLVGTHISTGVKQRCEWEGTPIDDATLLKNSIELYKQFKK
jgi:hypothetical protein